MKVLIADDHPMVRDALAMTLRLIDPDIEVVEACDFAAIERSMAEEGLSFALVDLKMPGMNGVAGIERLRQRFPALSMAVASGIDDPVVIRRVLGLGVKGYVPKSESAEALRRALSELLAGGHHVPMDAISDFSRGQLPPPPPKTDGLTARQRAVLALLIRGSTNKAISQALGIELGTVRAHVAAIFRVLEVRNRTEAAARVHQLDLAGHSADPDFA
jgi:DNA-binding NarL/FixJ family response regulator